MGSFRDRAAAGGIRHRWSVVLAWLLAAGVLLPSALHVEDCLEVSTRPLGSESAEVDRALAERFRSPFARSAILVVSGAPGPSHPEGLAALREIVEGLRAQPGVTGTFSYLDQPAPYFEGQGRSGTFLLVGLDRSAGRVDQRLPELRTAMAPVADRLSTRHPGATLRFTGEAAINVDLWRTSTNEARAAERRALPVTLALLLLAFGSVAAALLPVLTGVAAVALTFGAVGLLGIHWPLSILIVHVVSMLGLALGIDYALLTVSRFREARAAADLDPPSPAARYAGGTVALSGAAVAIGFAALLLVPLNELRSAGLGGLLVVGIAVLLAATLLPALLSWLGPWIEAGRLRPPRSERTEKRWRAWARRVVAHPWLVLIVAGTPVLLLAAQAARLNPRVPGGAWLPPQMESARAVRDLEAMGRAGVVDSLRVVLELPEDTSAVSLEGWEGTRRLAERFRRDPRVAEVQSLLAIAGEEGDPSAQLGRAALLPAVAKRAFLTEEGDGVLLEVVPREGVGGLALAALVRDLREIDVPGVTGLPGTRLLVGGLPAFNLDYERVVARRSGLVVGLVVGTTLLVLFAAFRSVLVPLKAVALNLLAVSASFGALVLVFQDGWGVRWMGLEGPVDGVFPIVPPLVFCTVFGLSMDYEVFLVSRVAEARQAGLDEGEALAEGLARTGGLITSAAAIMIAVFAAFILGGFVLIKMLGFALAVAVFLDATIIRIAIGPALLRLAGRLNWWPGKRSPG
jgi:putative drug exporter of the RND superfamily